MNISLNNRDALRGVLKIEVAKNDYEGVTEKSLREIRQKANMPGFRKGMVPMGIIRKMYGPQVLAEELNKLIAKSMTDYIKENNINLLGDPIPNETEQKKLDLENDENFEFMFDLAFYPEIDLTLSKEDRLTYYKIQVDDPLVDKKIDLYTNTYGTYQNAEKSEGGDLLKGLLVELLDGEPNPDGIMQDNAVIILKQMKNDAEREKFIGASVGEKIVFNPLKAYEGSDISLASLFNIEQAKAEEVKSDFSFEIQEITRNIKAELNQELFDRIFGAGVVKDETEFREKVKSFLSEQYKSESNYRFVEDFRKFLLDKTKSVIFADDIMKRWLLITNEKKKPEDIEKEYPQLSDDIRYQLAKNKLVREWNITINDKDVIIAAERSVKEQFSQYGMMSVPTDILDNYVKNMMEKPETFEALERRALEDNLMAEVKEKISVEEKTVTPDKLFNTDTKEEVKTD